MFIFHFNFDEIYDFIEEQFIKFIISKWTYFYTSFDPLKIYFNCIAYFSFLQFDQ